MAVPGKIGHNPPPMTHLFSPLTLKEVTLRNRIGVSPMCQYSSEDGRATDWHLVHLGSRAVGGAGLVIAEATAVTAAGRITPHDAGLWSDDQVEPLQRINRFLRLHGAVPGVQLAHAGRKAGAARPWEGGHHLAEEEGGWEPIGPGAEPFGGRLTRRPRPMTLADIDRVQVAFRAAAERALVAGYEFLEIHAAHGYLLHSFYSPLVNRRTDAYGGSFDNRIRLLLETVRQVRAVWPERFPLAVRLSATDWTPGGWTVEDSIVLGQRLSSEGVDLIDCSSGGASHASLTVLGGARGNQLELAEVIRQASGVGTAAVGGITDAQQADQIIRSGKADIVLLGRELLRDPFWPFHAARALGQTTAGVIPPQVHHWVG